MAHAHARQLAALPPTRYPTSQQPQLRLVPMPTYPSGQTVTSNTGPRPAANLPSGQSAQDLIDGKDGALLRVLSHFVLRSMIGGLGLAVVGFRGRDLVLGALGVGAAIELFVVAHRAAETLAERSATASAAPAGHVRITHVSEGAARRQQARRRSSQIVRATA